MKIVAGEGKKNEILGCPAEGCPADNLGWRVRGSGFNSGLGTKTETEQKQNEE